ncbi:hypothetical protein AL346_06005 [Chelatococcus sp. CO-6]|nr:hypothetical protein [Chelatococcus caeni]ALA17040.1 hypothetical protein AL346_06005 [Chelatococcus sp. CO-6]
MGRVVREHYPVSKLPEDLRDDLDPTATVRVVIEEEVRPGAKAPEQTRERQQIFKKLADFRRQARPSFSSADEINAHVRSLRDEWDR